MIKVVLLAGLLSTTLPVSATTQTNWSEVTQIQRTVEGIGAHVFWMSVNSERCAKQGLLGFYKPATRTVIMCQKRLHDRREKIIATLQHESWHAVQDICNRHQAVLSDDKIRALLSESDKRVLRKHYSENQHRLEAEARALENVPVHAFLNGVRHYC